MAYQCCHLVMNNFFYQSGRFEEWLATVSESKPGTRPNKITRLLSVKIENTIKSFVSWNQNTRTEQNTKRTSVGRICVAPYWSGCSNKTKQSREKCNPCPRPQATVRDPDERASVSEHHFASVELQQPSFYYKPNVISFVSADCENLCSGATKGSHDRRAQI